MKKFSTDELSKYNGKKGNPAYIGYQGKVFDVTSSFLWKEGTHQALHSAGMDLTDAITQAPHYADVLEKFPLVGNLHVRAQ